MSTLTPWFPEATFAQANQAALENIFAVTQARFPGSGAEVLTINEDGTVPEVAMDWMWRKFMGHQHGTLEGADGKLALTAADEAAYQPHISALHLGPHSFTEPTTLSPDIRYDKAFVLGGMPQEMAARLLAAVGFKPREADVRDIMTMTGQRLRWDTPTERTAVDTLGAVARHTTVDIDRLMEYSPWLQTELRRSGNEWERPLATEYAMGRLVTEAVFFDSIDWNDYPVTIVPDESANPLHYASANVAKVVPPREELLVSYHLQDGRTAHVLNAKAIPRPGALPRPTSDSQTREAVELLNFGQNEQLLTAASAPHIRAALDAAIRLLSLRKDAIARIDLANGAWVDGVEVLAALGELPATIKSDLSLRRLLASGTIDD